MLIFRKLISKKQINDSSVIVIPVSSKLTCQRYKSNYPVIINGKTNYIKVNDMRRISIKRLAQPYKDSNGNVVVLSDKDIANIKEIIRDYYVDQII